MVQRRRTWTLSAFEDSLSCAGRWSTLSLSNRISVRQRTSCEMIFRCVLVGGSFSSESTPPNVVPPFVGRLQSTQAQPGAIVGLGSSSVLGPAFLPATQFLPVRLVVATPLSCVSYPGRAAPWKGTRPPTHPVMNSSAVKTQSRHWKICSEKAMHYHACTVPRMQIARLKDKRQ